MDQKTHLSHFILLGTLWLALAGSATGSLLPVPEALAADGFKSGLDEVKKIKGEAGVKIDDPRQFILRVLLIILAPIAILAAGAVIYGGLMYIFSAGEEGKAQKAKHIIMYALIGLVIIGLAGALVNLVINLFK